MSDESKATRSNVNADRADARFIPAHVKPLSLRTALGFTKNVLSGIYFLGGIFLFLALLLVGCAMIVMVAEPLNFLDSIYLVSISALTIGYGDITPETTSGRFTAVVAGLIGMLATGLVIAVAVRAVEHTMRQEMARQRAEGDVLSVTNGEAGR